MAEHQGGRSLYVSAKIYCAKEMTLNFGSTQSNSLPNSLGFSSSSSTECQLKWFGLRIVKFGNLYCLSKKALLFISTRQDGVWSTNSKVVGGTQRLATRNFHQDSAGYIIWILKLFNKLAGKLATVSEIPGDYYNRITIIQQLGSNKRTTFTGKSCVCYLLFNTNQLCIPLFFNPNA